MRPRRTPRHGKPVMLREYLRLVLAEALAHRDGRNSLRRRKRLRKS